MSPRLAWSLPLALVLVPAAARANNTQQAEVLAVRTAQGERLVGRVKWGKAKLEVRGKKLPYAEVAAVGEPLPLDEAARAAALEELARRRGKLAADDAAGWARLGEWALERELTDEARAAFEAAVAADPAHPAARRGLGQMLVEGAWVETAAEVGRRQTRLAGDDVDGLLDLAELAVEHGAPQAGFGVLVAALSQTDGTHRRGLKLLRPLADAARQRTELILPVAGRWKASEDKTRHHQLNVSSQYALDLLRVDAEGRAFAGRGTELEQHFAYGQPFHAAAAGVVQWLQNDFPDLPAGTLGRADRNNGVGILHEGGEVSWYFHAQRGSITVAMGQRVERGQILGKVGNSGKSNVPHLHFALALRGFVGLPWRVRELSVVAPDGTLVPAQDVCPREGWTFEAPVPPQGAPEGASAPAGGE